MPADDRDEGTLLAPPESMPAGPLTFFDSLKLYVGFTDESSKALRELHPLAAPQFVRIVDDFYAAIEAHPGARAAITGGPAQIARLKQTLTDWLDRMLLGPHDETYFQRRARIGRVHVQIALPQQYMFTAMNRMRVRLVDVIATAFGGDAKAVRRIETAVAQIMDLELAIMLETYREDLETKNRNAERLATIGQFAASIGHELRNPLGVIESSLYLVRQHLGPEGASEPKVAKHLERIGSEVKRAGQTISDLLDLARNRPLRRVLTPIQPLLESAVEAALLPATVTIDAQIPEGLGAEVDPDQMRQVLVNLLANAAQAMRGSGRVVVAASPSPKGGVQLRVRDEGPGVPDDARPRLFEALFTTKAKGSGLGLALCRRILEAHGATIVLEPADPGRPGASFLLELPAGGFLQPSRSPAP
jgi:two-component system sensor histidine kinase HydH